MKVKLFAVVILVVFTLMAGKAYYDTHSIEVRHYEIIYPSSSFSPINSLSPQSSVLSPVNSLSPQSSVLSPVISGQSSLGEVLRGLKIAHLSDLHLKKMGLREEKLLEILNQEKPDLILITGDLVGFKAPYEPVMSFLEKIRAPLGVYAVLGNTEYSNENGSCVLCHEKGSQQTKKKGEVVFLRNSIVSLEVNGKRLNIIGLDDPAGKKSNLKTGGIERRLDQPSILLSHSPEIFEEASNSGIDLVLSGHTHGGQLIGVKYFRRFFPLIDPALEFLEGFFQKGLTLMYVSRGIGTSFLPFRLGVKPEVTFFDFASDLNPSTPARHFALSNNPPTTTFSGLSMGCLIETFNIFSYLNPFTDRADPGPSNVLFDFESEDDLKRLNWECHKWFERIEAHATSGIFSLRCVLPPGMYPGIAFKGIREDWSGYPFFKMDVFNPSEEKIRFHIRIDDHKSGWEYANRFDTNLDLEPGPNPISIPTDSIRTNMHHRPLHLGRIKRMMVFIPDNPIKRELYIDNIRLE